MMLLRGLADALGLSSASSADAAAEGAAGDGTTPRARISELWIYPVKSMKGQSMQSSSFDSWGLQHDRRFLVINEAGRFQTQRQIKALATISPAITQVDEATSRPSRMKLSIDPVHTKPVDGTVPSDIEFPVLSASSLPAPQQRTVKVWGDAIENAVDQGDEVASWLTRVLQGSSGGSGEEEVEKLRLVYFDPEICKRPVDERYVPAEQKGQEHTGFADGFPVLLTSEASLADLNEKIKANHEDASSSSPAPFMAMSRFRPNIVVQQLPSSSSSSSSLSSSTPLEPWAEEEWLEFSIIDGKDASVKATAQGVKKCSRCLVTTTDQTTAEQGGRKAEPLRTLFTYRADKAKRNCFFGSNLLIHAPPSASSAASSSSSSLAVGDLITVQRMGRMPPFDTDKPGDDDE